MSATTTATGWGGFAACQARLNAKAQAWAGFAACNDRLLVAHEAGNAFYRAIQKVLGHLVCRPNVGGQFIQALKKERRLAGGERIDNGSGHDALRHGGRFTKTGDVVQGGRGIRRRANEGQ